MSYRIAFLFLIAGGALGLGCVSDTAVDPGSDADVVPDASEPDASVPDASEPDASVPDASEPDASEPDPETPVCTPDESTECCMDEDCIAGDSCDLDSNTCFTPCIVGEGTECCGDTDCIAGDSCDLEANACFTPCILGGDTECCHDTDCAAGSTCNVEAFSCELIPLATCDACDPADDRCDAGLFCNTYQNPSTGAEYSQCGAARAAGSSSLCDVAAGTGGGCEATVRDNTCAFIGIGGSIELICTCDDQWSRLVATNAPAPALAECNECDPADDRCGAGLECHALRSASTGATFYECQAPLYAGDTTTCDMATSDYSGCTAANVGMQCSFIGIGGSITLVCACDGGWAGVAL